MFKSKEIREKMAKADKEQRKLIADAEKEDRFTLNETEEARYAELQSEYQNLEKQLKRQEELEERELEELEQEGKRHTPDVKVEKEQFESKEARDMQLGQLINGIVRKDTEKVTKATQNLKSGGHYRDFSTLVDSDGGIFLPTSVSSDIMEIEKMYGFIPRYARSFGNILSGTVKAPSVLSKLSFTGVSEGGTITGTTVDLGGIELKAHKWAGITNWTNELDEQAGAAMVALLNRQIAEGLAYIKDFTFLKGDGTSTYNNIKGLETLTGNVNYVRTATAASGNVSFATLDADDFLNGTLQVAPGVRNRGVFVMHPNMEVVIRLLKDSQGQFIYAMPNDRDRNIGALWGYPVVFTEAASYTDGTSQEYAYFVDPSMIAYADGRRLTLKELSEATVKDSNGTDVNLAMTDKKALRFTAMFDVKPSNAVVDDNGTTKGGFAVLKTAAA